MLPLIIALDNSKSGYARITGYNLAKKKVFKLGSGTR